MVIEFFGIPRNRAGVPRVELEFSSASLTLADVLDQLAHRFPALAAGCFEAADGLVNKCTYTLSEPYMVSVSGRRFVRDPATVLQPDDWLLLLSTDAGG